VSENDNTVTVHALLKSCGKSHGKERLKRKALRRPWKTDIEGVDVTCSGRLLFQVRAAATAKVSTRNNLLGMLAGRDSAVFIAISLI